MAAGASDVLELLGVSSAIMSAIETGLFAALLEQPGSAAAIARRLALEPRATERVLDVLAACGLARVEGEVYAAAPALVDAAERVPGGRDLLLTMWSHTPELLKRGEPFVRMDVERERHYSAHVSALGELFAYSADQLAAHIEDAPARVLDVGCGSGVWSLAIAERFPGTSVVGLDLPAVLAPFAARAKDKGLSDRIATLPGDMFEVEPPADFDLVIIANVLRLERRERARELVRRMSRAVRPGGSLLIVDALAHGTEEAERARAVYALHLALRTEAGGVHAPSEVRAWMNDAGLVELEAIALPAKVGALGALRGWKR
jgi:SAM-dependent methyltransferase